MPVYLIGGQRVRRKNLYMPCVVGPRFDAASPEEQARILKETYWADYVTEGEWPALLGRDDATRNARGRLRKKAAGWMIVLGRIARLNPGLFAEICERAVAEYERQTESEYPAAAVAGALVVPETYREWIAAEPGTVLCVQGWTEERDG